VTILYISYDGMLEPLGRSQVVCLLEHVASAHAVTLLSFEKPEDLRDAARLGDMDRRLRGLGVRWIRLRYHRRPTLPATACDVAAGGLAGWRACRERGIGLIHARGYVPSVIALTLKRMLGTPFVFDMRGFWADEKVDAGHWTRDGLPYRLAKRWERQFFEHADAIVSLTAEGVEAFPSLGYAIPAATPAVVIPTSADLARFAPGPKDPELVERLGLRDRVVIGCVGNLSLWYLRDRMLRYLAWLCGRLARASVLCVTREDAAALRADAVAAGIPLERLAIAAAGFEDMPAHLRLMDLGVMFRRVEFSKKGSLAAKLAEWLASGVPVAVNEGIGDAAALVRRHGVGVVVADDAPAAWEAQLEAIRGLVGDPAARVRCRALAEAQFDIRRSAARYLELYARLAQGTPAAALTAPREPEPAGMAEAIR
jgi:glycosyltransferase involved in cell wall biosynthesis